MAEQDYGRLSCRACALPFSKTLRKDGSPHGTQPLTCSRACRDRLLKSGGGLGRRRNADSAGVCKHCSGSVKSRCAAATFCGTPCKNAHFNSLRAAKRKDKAAGRIAARVERQASLHQARAEAADRRMITAFKRALKVMERGCRACAHCNAQLEWTRRICDSCRAERLRQAKRAEKHVRRARLKGVHSERVMPRSIFERDGWKCQICGCLTPEKLMGTNHPMAPTMDHIIAIANRGPHTRSNLQCACRRCNSLKSDGPARGQMGLWPAGGGEGLAKRTLST